MSQFVPDKGDVVLNILDSPSIWILLLRQVKVVEGGTLLKGRKVGLQIFFCIEAIWSRRDVIGH
ncbi:hypothetical protein JNB88_18605 [Rhizobium cauense]|uniref:hypothetical protein n=1 Tax=Rhizobium cauense TaxID=1166683 RepID=UPI001C6E519A|nr:hypothetical protein [Rhizobium cauense]MBW9115649.1 hypothetical protein [Rhizobium cauense]